MEHRFNELIKIMDRLRDEGGCPWDREQTIESLKTYIIEEAYEVLEAIDSNSKNNLKEELGDLLLQIVFMARIASEQGWFSIIDVLDSLNHKLVHRHPHVFADLKVCSSTEVVSRWEKYKKEEGKKLLEGVPLSLPSLLQALRVSEKVSRVGFDFQKIDDVIIKLDEEIAEFKQAINTCHSENIEDEIGDILFTMANIARFLKVNPEEALRKMVRRFMDRFAYIETSLKKAETSTDQVSIEVMDELWEKSKL